MELDQGMWRKNEKNKKENAIYYYYSVIIT